MKKSLRSYLLAVLLLLSPLMAIFAVDPDGDTYLTAERLFHIARSVNKNLVCYDVNLVEGKMDTHEPLKVYWVNREERPGETNGLSFFQRKMAYGYKLVSEGDDASVCTLNAYPERELTISRHEGRYVCLMMIDGKRSILQSLYVKVNPKNPLDVEYVELRGKSVAGNQPVTERIKR